MPPKRKSILVSEKLSLVQRWKRGESLNSLEKASGFQRSQIRNWVKQENKLLATNKVKKRVGGGGRKPIFPDIEKKIIEWFKSQRTKKLIVTYSSFRRESKRVADALTNQPNIFAGSNKWIRGVCKRNRITSRKITHQSQQDNCKPEILQSKVNEYIIAIHQKTADLANSNIFNMDETPCYFDMSHNRTLHFKGEKTIDGLNTGHSKNRFTVVLCISAAGIVVRTLIILKGLKKVPKMNIPKNIDVAVSMFGSMTTELMVRWINNCFSKRGGFANEKSLLVMDSYGSHWRKEIQDKLKQICNTDVLYIPPKTTSFLQPLDVSVNYPFKIAMRSAWDDWLSNAPEEFTAKGYRKKPSYQDIINFVESSVKKICPDIVRRSFECCAIGQFGKEIPHDKLNKRLLQILNSNRSEVGGLTILSEEDNEVESDQEENVEFVEADEADHNSDDSSDTDNDSSDDASD